MITETTKSKEMKATRGWVFYDGQCALCVTLANRFERILTPRGFNLAPLQTRWVKERLAFRAGEPLQEMAVLTSEGDLIGGSDAVVYLAGCLWWAWPLYLVAQVPGMPQVFRTAYRWIAEHRHCLGGACRHGGRNNP